MDSNMIPSLQNIPPLMVNAWAQTTSNVLHLNATDQTDHLKREQESEEEVKELRKQIRDHLEREEELEKEVTELSKQTRDHLKREQESEEEVKELRKQIRDHLKREEELEKEVEEQRKCKRKLLGMLSQLHGTTAYYHNQAILSEEQQPQHHLPLSPLYYNEITLNSEAENLNPSQNPGVICNQTPQISPNLANSPTSHTTSSNSVINPRQLISSANYESVNYTIVADGNADHNGEPIEIQLAEEDGALNLNNSADSGRLEICLEPEENIEDNIEVKPEQPIPALSEHHVLKRSKLEVVPHEVSPSTSGNSNHQQHHEQQHHQQWCEQQENHQEKYQNKQKGRLSNGLLKICKIEKTNDSSHTQATPIQASMPSPNNSISSQIEAPSTSHSYYVNEMVPLGPNGTRIPASLYESMSWKSPSIATRTLLKTIFGRHTLATHSMTGKESPAFKGLNKPVKNKLDPEIVADIVYAVSMRCNVSAKVVRNAITTKCADENKMQKIQMKKLAKSVKGDKENNKNIAN